MLNIYTTENIVKPKEKFALNMLQSRILNSICADQKIHRNLESLECVLTNWSPDRSLPFERRNEKSNTVGVHFRKKLCLAKCIYRKSVPNGPRLFLQDLPKPE